MNPGQRVMLIARLPSYGYATPKIGSVGTVEEQWSDGYLVDFDDWSEMAELCPFGTIVPIDDLQTDEIEYETRQVNR